MNCHSAMEALNGLQECVCHGRVRRVFPTSSVRKIKQILLRAAIQEDATSVFKCACERAPHQDKRDRLTGMYIHVFWGMSFALLCWNLPLLNHRRLLLLKAGLDSLHSFRGGPFILRNLHHTPIVCVCVTLGVIGMLLQLFYCRGTIHVLCAMVQRSGHSTCGYLA